jgi:hypothetical protein
MQLIRQKRSDKADTSRAGRKGVYLILLCQKQKVDNVKNEIQDRIDRINLEITRLDRRYNRGMYRGMEDLYLDILNILSLKLAKQEQALKDSA